MPKDKDGIEVFSKDPATRLKQAGEELGHNVAWHTYASIVFVVFLVLFLALWH